MYTPRPPVVSIAPTCNAIKAGDYGHGVLPSPTGSSNATTGLRQFEGDKGSTKERPVFSVLAEPFNVIARADSGIEKA